MFSRAIKICTSFWSTKEHMLPSDSLTHMKKKKKKKKSIVWHKIATFLFISHTALLKQVFQVILWQTLLCNIPLNICQMRVVSTSYFFWGWCTPSMKSLFQLSAPLMEPGYLPKRISVHQSVSGECGRLFVVNTLSFIFQTILQEPYSLISPLYFALSSDDLGQSQRTYVMWSMSQSQQGSSLKKLFFFIQQPRTNSVLPEQVLMDQFEETAGTDEQPSSSEVQGSALTLLKPLLIESCWRVGCGGVGCWCSSEVQTG